MKINTRKRVLAWVLTALLAVTYMPQMAFATDAEHAAEMDSVEVVFEPVETETEVPAEEPALESFETEIVEEEPLAVAAPISVLNGQVSISDSKGTGVLENHVVTITAPGVSLASEILEPNIVTITNNTAKPATISFDYTAENYKEFSIGQDSGTFSTVLEAGEAATVSITGRQAFSKNTAVLKMKNFSLMQVADNSAVKFEYDDKLGSITVDGAAVAAGTSVDATYAAGMTMTAVPAESTEFLGWINSETGRILSRELTNTYKPIEDIEIEAVFVNENSGSYYLVGNKYIISEFDRAMDTAVDQAYPVVVLMNDVTLPAGDYTVPAGVTLLVPFDDENTLYTDEPVGENGKYTTPVAYRTLTMAEGANLYVEGIVSLSAKHNAANSNSRGSGAPMGDVSFMEMEKNSTVTVKDGGFLYAYGYIVGEGEVIAKSGATIFENFQIEDFRGGSCTTHMAAKEEGQIQQGVLPISQYYIQNIEVPLTLEYGSTEFCWGSVYMLGTVMGSPVKFIGEDEAMFTLRDGSATKVYDGTTDRLIVEGNGNMSLSSITVYLDTTPIVASMFELPINTNITVRVNEGNVDINQDVALLPGAEIIIEEGAACTLGEGVSVYAYDVDQWGGYCSPSNDIMFPINYAPGKEYNRTVDDLKDAEICVNGTLDASRGFLYTTTTKELEGGGAKIYSTENGTIKLYSGEDENTWQFIQDGITGTYVPIYVTPAKLVDGEGNYVQSYDPDVTNPGTYTYSNGKWQCDHPVAKKEFISEATCTEPGITKVTCGGLIPHTYDIVDPAKGHKWGSEYIVDMQPTCDEDGSKSIHCQNCDATKNVSTIPATGHSFSDFTVVTEPGCETAGSEKATCDVCKEEITQEIPALGHDMVYADEIPATCTEKGSMSSGECSRCDYTVEAGEIPALGHSFTKYTETKAPECTETGAETAKCDRCDVTDIKEIPALGHSFTKYVDNNNATCTLEGTETAVCDRTGCNETQSQSTSALGHKWETSYTVDVEPGCATRGSKSIHCAVCDEIKEDSTKTIYARGHEYGSWISVSNSTCKVAGTEERVCDICGGKDVREKALAAHKWEDMLTVDREATCTVNGFQSYHCSVCDEMDDVTVIPATGHKLGEYVDNGDVTCTTAGTETAVCATCGEEDTRIVAALGHNWDTNYTVDRPATCAIPGVQSIHCGRCDETKDTLAIPVSAHSYTEYKNNTATCTAAGTAQSTCDYGCGTTETVETPALGHSYSEWKVVKAASCTAEGSSERSCEVCGKKETAVIEKTGHAWETAYTVDIEPTCDAEGKESQHCADCDASRVPRPIAALGHDTVKHAGKAATCTSAGWKDYVTCTRCDYTEYQAVPATGHTPGAAATCTTEQKCTVCGEKLADAKGHSYKESVVAPTCTEAGYTNHECACGESYKTDETAALGHDYGQWTVTVKQSCVKEGKQEQSCNRCDHKITQVIPMDAHITVEKITEPTCTEKGLKQLICTGCGEVRSATDIPARGHKPGAAATCTTAQKCTDCGVQLTAALGHAWETEYTVDQTATIGRAGSKSYHCSVCDAVNTGSVVTIAKIKKTTAATLVYNGYVRNNNVTVVDYDGNQLIKGRDYKVAYKNAKGTKAATPKLVGKYKVVVTFKGDYSGSVEKTFTIKPKATSINKLTKPAKKQIKVTWQKRTVQVDGYQIRVSLKQNMNSSKMVLSKGKNINTKTIKNLKSKKKYWVQVRTYKTVNGVKIFSEWSAKKTIVTK